MRLCFLYFLLFIFSIYTYILITEWLDSGNNKKALQECDKVLKKTPNLLCAKALKALSVLRMGRESECTNILDALVAENPADDATLQAMTLCYRELQQRK